MVSVTSPVAVPQPVVVPPSPEAGQPAQQPQANPYGVSQVVGVQNYLPLGNGVRRPLTPTEVNTLANNEQRWFPAIAPSNLTPLPALVANPTKGAIVNGAVSALFTGVGASLAMLGSKINTTPKLVISVIAATLAGGIGAVSSYLGRKQHNENIIDTMMRLPEGATYRDLKADPVYQAEANRAAESSRSTNDTLTTLALVGALGRGGSTNNYYSSSPSSSSPSR
jgi:hypothetical protein